MEIVKTLYHLRPGANFTEDGIERVTAWAKANGLDANAMPEQSTICVEGDELAVTVVVGSVDDILPGDEGVRLEVRRTVPLVEVPPRDLFAPWEVRR